MPEPMDFLFLGSHFVFTEHLEMFCTVLPVEQIDGVNLPLPPSLRWWWVSKEDGQAWCSTS